MYSRVEDKEEDVPCLPVDTITIQIPSRKPFCINYFGGQTIGEVKKIIEQYSQIPSTMQRLAFNGTVLRNDDVTLQHVGVAADSRIHCFPRPNGSIPLATSATPGAGLGLSSTTPIVVGIVQNSSNNHNNNNSDNLNDNDTARSDQLRQRGFAYHVYIQWAFRVRLFSLMMIFFYGFGMISNIAYWLGDKDMPDDREMVPGQTPHELTGPIYFLDFISNVLGITAAMLGLRAVRENSIDVAKNYFRVTMALILFSAIQLCMEVYAFSDQYQKHNPSGSSSSNSTTANGKKWDDMAFTVALNLLVRGLFWSLILNTSKKYMQALIVVNVANAQSLQVPDIEEPQAVAQGTPVMQQVTATTV